jgi:hypothetical protein
MPCQKQMEKRSIAIAGQMTMDLCALIAAISYRTSPRNSRLLVGLMSYPFRYRLKVFKALTQSRAPIFFPSSRLRGK